MNCIDILNKLHYQIPQHLELMKLGLHSKEIDYALNRASFDVFIEFFKKFEQDQTAKFGITNLLVSNELGVEATGSGIVLYPFAKLYNSSEMYFTVDDHVIADDIYVPVKSITHDYYQSNIKNPMRVPDSATGFWRLDIGTVDNTTTYREIILDKVYSVVNYYASYIKKPSIIDSADITSGIDINDEIIDGLIIPKALQIIVNKYATTSEK